MPRPRKTKSPPSVVVVEAPASPHPESPLTPVEYINHLITELSTPMASPPPQAPAQPPTHSKRRGRPPLTQEQIDLRAIKYAGAVNARLPETAKPLSVEDAKASTQDSLNKLRRLSSKRYAKVKSVISTAVETKDISGLPEGLAKVAKKKIDKATTFQQTATHLRKVARAKKLLGKLSVLMPSADELSALLEVSQADAGVMCATFQRFSNYAKPSKN